ncbi:MAG: hypothetical protein AAGJ18_11360 [Bacteroidota bacterium]
MPDDKNDQPHHVLILGCGRSGTSIFGEFFQHLSSYTYFSEPPYANLKKMDFSKPIAIKVPEVSADYPPTEGLSFPLEDLYQTIPQPLTIFWQVRHPLDTICSLKVGIAKNWGHHPQPVDWRNWVDKPLIERCAHHWNYLNTVGYEKLAEVAHLSKFEEAILDTQNFARKVANLVKVDAIEEQVNIQNWCNRVQNTNNAKFVEAETSRAYSTKDHKVKVGRWLENMTSEELEIVVPMIQDTAKKFGYDLTNLN